MWSCGLFMLMVILAVHQMNGAHLEPTRVKRGIWGTATSTVFKTVDETRYVPASCVHVAPNLPQCRREKLMYYPSFETDAFKFFNIGNHLFPSSLSGSNKNSSVITKRADTDLNNPTTAQGWGEFLGFYRPTVTVTELKIRPTTVLDSRIMVTYDIRDCKPRELPYNLPKCAEENSAEIVPTTTVSYIRPTVAPQGLKLPEELQGAETSLEDHQPVSTVTQGL